MKIELSIIEISTIRLGLMDKIEYADKCIDRAKRLNDSDSEKFFTDIRNDNKNLLERLYKV